MCERRSARVSAVIHPVAAVSSRRSVTGMCVRGCFCILSQRDGRCSLACACDHRGGTVRDAKWRPSGVYSSDRNGGVTRCVHGSAITSPLGFVSMLCGGTLGGRLSFMHSIAAGPNRRQGRRRAYGAAFI